jgi:hypothetical protein
MSQPVSADAKRLLLALAKVEAQPDGPQKDKARAEWRKLLRQCYSGKKETVH